MDNASKALIMAGSILIAIGLVGFGVFLYSNSTSLSNSVIGQMDAVAAQTTNSELRRYAGKKVSGSLVTDFIEYVKVLNTNKALPADIKIASSKFDNSAAGKIVKSTDLIDSNSYYTVILNDGNNDGYYDLVQITKNFGVVGDVATSGESGEITDLTEIGSETESGDGTVSGEVNASGEVNTSGETTVLDETNPSGDTVVDQTDVNAEPSEEINSIQE